MRRTEADEAVELILKAVQVWKSSANYYTAHRITNHCYTRKLVAWAIFTNVLENFLTEAVTHLCDITLCLPFIRRRLKENSLW